MGMLDGKFIADAVERGIEFIWPATKAAHMEERAKAAKGLSHSEGLPKSAPPNRSPSP